ncbi:MAG TPA: ABC transporter substrate-binding protein [Candidatus Desulfaltia sp.]|nr:ABC transporter substrate-binding protein [Candidatus Desulfaltia sp.]
MSVLRCRAALFLFFIPVVLVLAFQSRAVRSQAVKPRPGGTLRLRTFTLNPFQPQFDPAGGANVFILNQIFDGLVGLDKNLSVVGVLADYWMISDDGRTYTFFLRKGVKFHHGRELEAADIKFSLERLVSAETEGPHYQFFTSKVVGAQEYREGKASEVEGFKVRDRHTFEIQWKNPYVSALYLLSMDFCKILPRDLVQRQGRGFFQRPSGTGPFKFANWLRNSRLDIVGVRLERNNAYFLRKPYLEAVEFNPYYTPEQFLAEDVDIIPYSSDRLSGRDIQVLEGETFATAFLMMSCHRPPLDKASVRRAISLAIDKKEIAKASFRLDSEPRVTNNFIPPRLPGFYPVDEEGFDPEAAKRILLEEGFSDEQAFPRINLFLHEEQRNGDTRVSEVLKDQLAAIGINLRIRTYRTYDEVRSSKEPYLLLLHWSLDFPDPENIIMPLFYSSAVLNQNILQYSNPGLDELAQATEIEQSRKARIALFHKIEQLLMADLPAIPLYSRQHRLAVQPYVRGVKVPPLGFFYLDAREIWLDK